MLPLESDPFPLLPLLHIHFNTPVFKQDAINGVMRDMYPMDLFYLLLEMNRSKGMSSDTLQNQVSYLFGDTLRFSTRFVENGNCS